MGSHGQAAWPRGLVNTGMGLHEQLVCSRRRSVCRCAFTVMVGTLEGLAELTTTDCVPKTQAHWGDSVRLDSIRPLHVRHAPSLENAHTLR